MIDKDNIIASTSIYGDSSAQFIGLVLKDAARFYTDIVKSIESEDIDLLKISAHSLKSILREAGADEAADHAFTLEKIAGAGHMTGAKNTMEKFAIAYDETVTILKQLI